MANVTEELFGAVSILIENQLKAVKFDETIQATVTDASKADSGEYMVSTGSATFKAYSTETRYKEKDAVLVTIPQGNYDNQKLIVGKAVDDMNTPMIYTSPFETIIDITGNLITTPTSWDYWANDSEDYVWEIGTSSLRIIRTQSVHLENVFYKGYTTLGLQAQFSTWLSEYETTQGNYGLIVGLTFVDEDSTVATSDNSFQAFFVLDSDEFFGDVYNFETYYIQEQVFDISEYINYPIVDIQIFPYQRNNFKSIDGTPIPSPSDDDFSTINPNIFIKDPYICLGTFAKDFKNDTAEILVDSSPYYYKEKVDGNTTINEKTEKSFIRRNWSMSSGRTEEEAKTFLSTNADFLQYAEPYFARIVSATDKTGNKWDITYTRYRRPYENLKNVLLRWIHKDTATGIIKTVEDKDFPSNYEVRWYRYKLGAPSPEGDKWAGAHWERFYGCKGIADEGSGDWTITEDELLNAGAVDLATNTLFIEFQPNVNLQTEKLKAIILKQETNSLGGTVYRLIATSNILELTNNTDVRSKATIIDANTLSIKYDDDEKGHYFLYDEGGDVGANENLEVRRLIAVFDPVEQDVYLKAILQEQECSSIKWTFPAEGNNTMIVPMTGYEGDVAPAYWDSSHEVWLTAAGGTEIGKNQNTVGFTIKPHLNHTATNNTILLEIVKDGQNYQAQVQPIFGTAGTNGSDYTVILQWRYNKNALDLSEGADHTLIGDIALYDQAGNFFQLPDESSVKCEWEVAHSGTTNEREPADEEIGLYYPVLHAEEVLHQSTALGEGGTVTRIDADYYYIYDENNLSSYKYFDITATGSQADPYFKSLPNGANPAEYQLYQQSSENDSPKKKVLEFKQINFTQSPTINEQNGTWDNVRGDNLAAIVVVNNKKQYYYSAQQSYFVKYDNLYILDPWRGNFQETETYYEPVTQSPTKYRMAQSNNGVTAGYLTAKPEQDNENNWHVTISASNGVNMNQFYILKLIIQGFGDFDLVTYYPIPMKYGETIVNGQKTFIVDYIEGPDRVRYGSSGETDFNKNPYKIVTRYWKNSGLASGESPHFEKRRHGFKDDTDILPGYWKIIHTDENMQSNFKSSLVENATDGNGQVEIVSNGEYNIPTLNPVGIYIDTAPNYAVQFVYKQGGSETILWTQPILAYQNKYPSRTLNKWNGKDIQTDEDTGTITASGFAAGKKESSDNSFTGVVIGDWSRTKADTCMVKNTGIYGFNHGEMSYAFKDDGTAFLGKSTRGRIHFDGNKSQIYSSNWKGNNHLGMFLDIDDGVIKLHNQNSTINSGDINHNIINSTSIVQKFFNLLNGLVDSSSGNLVFAENQNSQVSYSNIDNYKVYREISKPKYFKSGLYNRTGRTYSPITNSSTDSNYFGDAPIKVYELVGLSTFISSGEIDQYITGNFFNTIYYTSGNSTTPIIVGFDNNSQCYVYNSNYKYYFGNSGNSLTPLQYITLSAAESTYPLSIGTVLASGRRNFRVRWDGKTFITDGDFSGTINAKGGKISGDLDVYSTLTVYGTIEGGYIHGATIEGATIRGSGVYADYLEAGLGNIGGWTISEYALSGGETILHSQNGITTNYITISGTGVTGTIGQTSGLDDDGETKLLGIKALSGDGIAIETRGNIRLSGIGSGVQCAGVDLQASRVTLGGATTQPNVTVGKLTVQYNNNRWELVVSGITADAQSGIYARFA